MTETSIPPPSFDKHFPIHQVLGKIKPHKDADSHLATHLLRTENAEVAVKMLPEYADDLSKGDFLKEIALCKQLGFHER